MFKKNFLTFVALLVVAASASAQTATGIPEWVSAAADDATTRNFVGIRSNARTLEEARNGAITDALDKIVQQVYGGKVTGEIQTFRSDIGGKITDEFSQKSSFTAKSRDVSDLTLARWEWSKNADNTFNAFVLMAYPKAAIDRAKSRDRQSQLEAETGLENSMKQADEYIASGDVRKALQACVSAYGYSAKLSEKPSDAAARKAEEIARMISLSQKEEGKVSVMFGEKPLARAQLLGTGATKEPQILKADDQGVLNTAGILNLRELRLDSDWFLSMGSTGNRAEETAFAGAVKALKSPVVKFKVKLTGAKIIVMVDESDDEGLAERSMMANVIGKKLVAAGFRYITDTQIGKVNFEAIDDALDRGQIEALKPALKAKADVTIHGTVKVGFGTETGGVQKWIAEGTVTATRLIDGVTLATDSDERVFGFGSSDKAAAKDALTKFAEKIADSLLSQMLSNE